MVKNVLRCIQDEFLIFCYSSLFLHLSKEEQKKTHFFFSHTKHPLFDGRCYYSQPFLPDFESSLFFLGTIFVDSVSLGFSSEALPVSLKQLKLAV